MVINTKKFMLIGSVVALGVISNVAMAVDGKIDFQGAVTATTCDISVNKQGKNAVVTLPTVSSQVLKVAGNTAGRTALNFQLSNCTLAGGITKASVFFVASPNINTAGRLVNTQTAGATSNVDLQILNANLDPMDLSVGAGYQNPAAPAVPVPPVAIAGGTANLRHYVQYYATGASTAGSIRASVEYEINYE